MSTPYVEPDISERRACISLKGIPGLWFSCQWYNAPLTAPSPMPVESHITFMTAERYEYMMYHKGILFGDGETVMKIMSTTVPSKQKALKRQVKEFKTRCGTKKRKRLQSKKTGTSFVP